MAYQDALPHPPLPDIPHLGVVLHRGRRDGSPPAEHVWAGWLTCASKRKGEGGGAGEGMCGVRTRAFVNCVHKSINVKLRQP